jgi:hypothetical protein
MAGKSNAMVGVQDSHVALVPLNRVIGIKKQVSAELLLLSQELAS